MTNAIAVFLFVGVICYTVLGGADFGAGFWDLTAGGARRGHRPREVIDHSIGPIWEANHTWLIYILVMLWSGFPTAFYAIMTTLWIPFLLAGLGIVLRGTGFAFRKSSLRTPQRRVYGVAFAFSSVVSPFFFGTIAGALASGRVPTQGYGDPIDSWTGATSVFGGVLAVLVCAYLAAVFLVVSARGRGEPAVGQYFRVRAVGMAVVAGLASLIGIPIVRSDSPRLFDQLTGTALPLLIVAVLAGLVTLLLLGAGRTMRWVRELAALAVAASIAAWGVAQYPYLLGTHLRIADAASPTATLWVLVVVACLAGAVIVPSLVLMYTLYERGALE